jgi:glutathione synthase/RimK-type ligase-like ATP-grasp enzyme
MADRGDDLVPLAFELLGRIKKDGEDAGAMRDLGTIMLLLRHTEVGLAYQARAFELRQLYRDSSATAKGDGLRLLAFAAPGDLMANTPIQFLLDGSDICLDILYVVPDMMLPDELPDHDIAMVIAGQSDANRPVLDLIATFADRWPMGPLLNDPRKVARLTRDGVFRLLTDVPGLLVPETIRIDDQASAQRAFFDHGFPIIIRPVDSHARRGLTKLDDAAGISDYLAAHPAQAYYLSRFVDYRNQDGLYRKFRIALIGGEPYLCHMAVSDHWIVHYVSAGMHDSAAKRHEEARAFDSFSEDFRRRHSAALTMLAERVGLDYFAIDCAETSDGRLLVFEVDTAMAVHCMDSPDIFPYKPPQMRAVFTAFQNLLRRRVGTTASSASASPIRVEEA